LKKFTNEDFDCADQIEIETENYVDSLKPEEQFTSNKTMWITLFWVGAIFFAFLLMIFLFRTFVK